MAKYKLKNISTPLELLKTVNDLKVNAGSGGSGGSSIDYGVMELKNPDVNWYENKEQDALFIARRGIYLNIEPDTDGTPKFRKTLALLDSMGGVTNDNERDLFVGLMGEFKQGATCIAYIAYFPDMTAFIKQGYQEKGYSVEGIPESGAALFIMAIDFSEEPAKCVTSQIWANFTYNMPYAVAMEGMAIKANFTNGLANIDDNGRININLPEDFNSLQRLVNGDKVPYALGDGELDVTSGFMRKSISDEPLVQAFVNEFGSQITGWDNIDEYNRLSPKKFCSILRSGSIRVKPEGATNESQVSLTSEMRVKVRAIVQEAFNRANNLFTAINPITKETIVPRSFNDFMDDELGSRINSLREEIKDALNSYGPLLGNPTIAETNPDGTVKQLEVKQHTFIVDEGSLQKREHNSYIWRFKGD